MWFRGDKNVDIPKRGLFSALAAFTYVAAVVVFFSLLQNPDTPDSPAMDILAPLGLLMLFVLSAAVMGLLLFGRPVMLYIDGKKNEAVRLLAWTVGSFAVITACVLAVMTFAATR